MDPVPTAFLPTSSDPKNLNILGNENPITRFKSSAEGTKHTCDINAYFLIKVVRR